MFLSDIAQWDLKKNNLDNTNLLISLIVLTIVISSLLLITVSYLVKFVKNIDKKESFINKPLISLNILIQTIGLVLVGVCYIIFYGKNFISNPNTAFYIIMSLVATSAIFVIIAIVWLFFFGHLIMLSFGGKAIHCMGEIIEFSKITKLVKDTNKAAIYINYLEGKRNNKKLKFPTSKVITQFLITNVGLTGIAIEETNQDEYFKNLVQETKMLMISELESKQENLHKNRLNKETKVEEVKDATSGSKPKAETTTKTTTTKPKVATTKTAASKPAANKPSTAKSAGTKDKPKTK